MDDHGGGCGKAEAALQSNAEFSIAGHGRPGVVRDDIERKQQLQLIKERETKRGLDRFSSDGNHQRHEADY